MLQGKTCFTNWLSSYNSVKSKKKQSRSRTKAKSKLQRLWMIQHLLINNNSKRKLLKMSQWLKTVKLWNMSLIRMLSSFKADFAPTKLKNKLRWTTKTWTRTKLTKTWMSIRNKNRTNKLKWLEPLWSRQIWLKLKLQRRVVNMSVLRKKLKKSFRM